MIRPELFKDRGKLLEAPKGVLFYGPPGTAKTMTAKALAKEGNVAFFNIEASTILNMWQGESQKLIHAVFSLAERLAPAVIFCDEIDAFLGASISNQRDKGLHVSSLLAEFTCQWDGLLTNHNKRIVIIGATNRPENIEKSILRRMPIQFLFELPNETTRAAILKILLNAEPVAPDLDIPRLANITTGYSGCDLKELCKRAAMSPIRDFLESEKKYKEDERGAAALFEIEDTDSSSSPSSSSSSSQPSRVKCSQSKGKIRPIVFQDFIDAMRTVKPTGTQAKHYALSSAFP